MNIALLKIIVIANVRFILIITMKNGYVKNVDVRLNKMCNVCSDKNGNKVNCNCKCYFDLLYMSEYNNKFIHECIDCNHCVDIFNKNYKV